MANLIGNVNVNPFMINGKVVGSHYSCPYCSYDLGLYYNGQNNCPKCNSQIVWGGKIVWSDKGTRGGTV